MVQDIEDRLKNWAWYVNFGTIGPQNPTRCASAEGNYESEDVWEGEEPRYEPDMLDGEIVENAIRVLPNMSRMILKAVFVQYPYHRPHTVAQRLKMSTDRLEGELQIAKRRLAEQLRTAHRGMVQTTPGPCNSVQG